MLTLPWWSSWPIGGTALAVVDAMVLTGLLSPALWFVVVRPLRVLFDQRGRLLLRVMEVQEEERARISRDLHDELGQVLTTVLVGLRTVEQATDLAQARERALGLHDVAAVGLESVRRLSRGLRTGVLAELGLRTAVERLCEDWSAASGVDIVPDVELPVAARFAPAVETAAYRVVQEAVTNVVRHSQAARAEVHLRLDSGTLEIGVRDDGCGIKSGPSDSSGEGVGLQGMRERVALLGGEIRIESARGEGTTILIRLPGVKVLDEPHQSPDR